MKYLTGDDNGLWKIISGDSREITRKVLGRDYDVQSRQLAITHMTWSGGVHGYHEDEVTLCRSNGIVEAFDHSLCSTRRRVKIDSEGAIFSAVIPGAEKKRLFALGTSGKAYLLDWSINYNDIEQSISEMETVPDYVLKSFKFQEGIQCAHSDPTSPNRIFYGGKEVNAKCFDVETGTEIWSAKNVRPDELDLRTPVNIFSITNVPSLHPDIVVTGEEKGKLRVFDMRQQRRAVLDTVITLHKTHKRVRPLTNLITTPVVRTVTLDWLNRGAVAPAWGSSCEEADEHCEAYGASLFQTKIKEEELEDNSDEEEVDWDEVDMDCLDDDDDEDEDESEDESEDNSDKMIEDAVDEAKRKNAIPRLGLLHRRIESGLGTLIVGDNIGNVYKIELRQVERSVSFKPVAEEELESASRQKRKRLMARQQKIEETKASAQSIWGYETRTVGMFGKAGGGGKFSRNDPIMGAVKAIAMDPSGEVVIVAGLGRKAHMFDFHSRKQYGDGLYLRQKLHSVLVSSEPINKSLFEKQNEDKADVIAKRSAITKKVEEEATKENTDIAGTKDAKKKSTINIKKEPTSDSEDSGSDEDGDDGIHYEWHAGEDGSDEDDYEDDDE